MKYQIQLCNCHSQEIMDKYHPIEPLILKPEINIEDAAYWQERIRKIGQDLERVSCLQVRPVVKIV